MPTGRRNRLWILLAIALALAALATTAITGSRSGGDRVLVSVDALEAGVALDDALADGRAGWRALDGLGDLRGLVVEPELPERARLSRPVDAGELISEVALGSSALPELRTDERLVSLPIGAAGAVTSGLVAGTPVDVASTAAEGPLGAASLIAENAVVEGVETAPGSAANAADGIVVRLDAGEALAVSEALAGGRDLRLIVRPQEAGP